MVKHTAGRRRMAVVHGFEVIGNAVAIAVEGLVIGLAVAVGVGRGRKRGLFGLLATSQLAQVRIGGPSQLSITPSLSLSVSR